MKKLLLILCPLLFFMISCENKLLYDFESQTVADVIAIDQYLSEHNIPHLRDISGIRYEVLHRAMGEVLKERQYANFEVTVWRLDGTFYASSNQEIDNDNEGRGQFWIPTRRYHSDNSAYADSQYFSVIAPRMTLGDRYRLYVPSTLGYGFETENQIRPIAPNTNLIVEIEMTEIVDY